MSNVKPGDLARIVGGFEQNIGKRVCVTQEDAQGCAMHNEQWWRVTSISGPLHACWRFSRTHDMTMSGGIADRDLRRIDPSELQDPVPVDAGVTA